MTNKSYKILTLIFTALFCIHLSIPAYSQELADSSTIYISSAEELQKLSKKCALDIWSSEKTIILTGDIDLKGIDFVSIPTFSGTFDGQGYTIKNLNIDENISIAGFFCIIEKDGIVKNLNIEGNISPSGTQEFLGGICGKNYGKIVNCSFKGTVSGDTNIGGIAGINELSGQIFSCETSGSIEGNNLTGGIAGENAGTISSCANMSNINNFANDKKIELSDIELEINLEDLQSNNSSETIINSTDTGGIAGYSYGMLLSSSNYGTIGYNHVGYNIGGIAGRSKGYVDNCKNYGPIYGRKEVGGIVGQMEPDIKLIFDDDTLDKLKTELDTLKTLIDTTLDNADTSSDTVYKRLEKILDSTDSVIDTTDKLSNGVTDWGNENIDEINRFSDLVADTINRTVPILEDTESMSDLMQDGIDELKKGLDELSEAVSISSEAFEDLQLAIDDLEKVNSNMYSALKYMREGIDLLRDSIVIGNTDTLKNGMEELKNGLLSLSESFAEMNICISRILDILNEISSSEYWTELKDALNELAPALKEVSDNLVEVSQSLEKLLDALINNNYTLASQEVSNLSGNLYKLSNSFKTVNTSLQTLSGISDNQNLKGDVEVFPELWNCFNNFSNYSNNIAVHTNNMKNSMQTLSNSIPTNNRDDINNSLNELKAELEQLNNSLSAANEIFSQITDILEKINTDEELKLQYEQLKKEFDRLADISKEVSDAFIEINTALHHIDESNINIYPDNIDSSLENFSESLNQLMRASKNLDKVSDHMTDLIDELKDASEHLEDFINYTSSAADIFSKSASMGTSIIDDIYNLVDDISKKDKIHISPINEDIRKTGDELHTSLLEISSEMALLNKDINSISDTTTSDLKAINNQMSVIADIIDEIIDKIKNAGDRDYFEDTSSENIDGTTIGKVSNCLNKGKIYGDKNIGGIVGTISINYEMDPEDDIIQVGETSSNFQYETKAIVQKCINRSQITSKKDNSGGIAGLMTTGIIIDCENYGGVLSEGGNYVGGIAGQSTSMIKQSWSKCTLLGNKYIGGIAGSGNKIYDCRSIVEISDFIQFGGAISGNIDGEFSNNLFVSESLAGMDRFSYSKKAEPVSYSELIKLNNTPYDFKYFLINFIVDDEIIKTISFDYGESVDTLEIPKVPEKKGYYAAWDNQDFSYLTFDKDVTAVYTEHISSVSSGTKRNDGCSIILVDGEFTQSSTLSIAKVQNPNLSSSGLKETWQITIPKDKNEVHTVRYLPIEDKKVNSVYILENGNWEEVPYSYFGKYILFEAKDSSLNFCIDYKESSKAQFIVIGILALAVFLSALTIKLKKKKVNK